MEYNKWLTYWKKNLSESIKMNIDIDKLDKQQYFEIENYSIDTQDIQDPIKANNLIDFQEIRINKKKGVEDKNSEKWVSISELDILISPIKIKATTENLVYLKDKKAKYPFWFYAKLNRDGSLNIPEETFPGFQRKYLEPVADEKTEFIFGSLESVDNAAAIGKEEFENYSDYISYVRNVFELTIHKEFENYTSEGYETIYNGIILVPDEEINAAIGIIQLYEKILKEKKKPELLKTFIALNNNTQNKPLEVSQLIDSNFLHVGQMGADFPLSISQRKSLYTYLKADDKVFAVNGPPGTGKTTLLQSIVANKLVESAVIGQEAPIILACSSNNQAVTNIIDSFSKTKEDDLPERWLPEIKGYATYLPANGKTEVELKGINYKKQSGEGLFGKIENSEYLIEAKAFFTQKSTEHFGIEISDIKKVVNELQKEIVHIQSKLKAATLKWNDYLNTERIFSDSYQVGKGEKYYLKGILNEDVFLSDIDELIQLEDRIIFHFKNESFFRKIFCYFKFESALKNRASEINRILRDSLITVANDFIFIQSSILQIIDEKIKTAKIIVDSVEKWKEWKTQNSIVGNPPKTEAEYWDFEYQKIRENGQPNCFYDELDVTFRHEAFQLALHFWEGKYLLKLEIDLKDPNIKGKGIDSITNTWKRQAMLTPCFVSTFYMAPKFFSSFKFLTKGENGKNIFDNPCLYNFIDLLIVDEAGQVPPEVGVATFSLAKRAIIVGDVKQIEPVWNVSSKIDIGNLKKCEIIKDYDDTIYEKEFDAKGFLSSSGSIMKMAQNACNFKADKSNEKGLTLTEHRRCYDEIIDYCNVLAYNGELIPLRGKAKNDLLFPPMYCIHVEGNSVKTNTSRHNQNEVTAIVTWLIANATIIQEKYGRLEDAVGIITPFVGQKISLRYALKRAGFNVDLLKIGTVHALQGAERSIILFSMVYGKDDSGTMFFDRDNKPNMLNVAVSRAKDNFIVFANTGILDKAAETPSGKLSNHLTYESKSVNN